MTLDRSSINKCSLDHSRTCVITTTILVGFTVQPWIHLLKAWWINSIGGYVWSHHLLRVNIDHSNMSSRHLQLMSSNYSLLDDDDESQLIWFGYKFKNVAIKAIPSDLYRSALLQIVLAAEMIGYFVPPDVYWRLMLHSVQDAADPGPLRILAAVIHTSQGSYLQSQLHSIADTLASETLCHNKQVSSCQIG